MTIQEAFPHVQAVRGISENGSAASKAALADTIYLVCHPDPSSGKDILLWDDIVAAFKDDVVHVRSGAVVIPFLKGPDFKKLDPLRIPAVPGVTLDVVVREPLVRTEAFSSTDSSGTSPPKDLSLESLQQVLPNKAYEISTLNVVAPDVNTATTTARREPVYGLENTAMDNYTHIDMPDDIRALSLKMLLGPYQEQSNANPIIANTTVSASATTIIPSSAPRNPASDHENIAMDAYRNNVNPAFTPPPRAPQRLSVKRASPTSLSPPTSSQNAGPKAQSFRAPQEFASDITNNFTKTMKNARLGDKDAQFALGDMYIAGKGVTQDYHHAMTWYLKAAKQGHTEALNSLGLLYQSGTGVSMDHSQAVYWFRKAAEQGNAGGQNNLGFMYLKGKGVPQDYSQAMFWMLKAAEQGDVTGQGNVADQYRLGEGVKKDPVKAMEWYLKAASQGDVNSLFWIGYMYGEGLGVPQDYSQAMVWFIKAADQGVAIAQCNIGYMYRNGYGVTHDDALAMEWYRKAADQGDKGAQYIVGRLYEYSMGVENDKAAAMQWYKKAAEQGHPNAKGCVSRLEGQGYGAQGGK
ncbi:hypothetical protein BGZ97_005024 [Linnemannia gamsii]|uniref:HCP-like protein n=1 Tax=Linnemannia gamsii TaxID=64522 RepID=A0A9P6QR16_9FUNG|nr:hypothetical protein BGZ97_005024 [Linnemannia gamsii]